MSTEWASAGGNKWQQVKLQHVAKTTPVNKVVLSDVLYQLALLRVPEVRGSKFRPELLTV
jgi:hypothetical protein